MIGMHLGVVGPERHVEQLGRSREHGGSLHFFEHLARHLPCGAVHAQAGDLARPVLGASLGVGEIGEGLAVAPALADVGHLVFDARLVLRRAHARGVDEDSARLRVVEERRDDRGIERVRLLDDRRHVVGHDRLDHRAEEPPGAVEPLAHRLGGLQERRPHELIATERERDDERPESARAPGRDVEHHPHLAEVDLRLLARRRIFEEDRRLLLLPAELLHRVAAQRVVARNEPMIAHEQRVDLAEPQRPLLAEPVDDVLLVRCDRLALRARVRQRSRLHALRDLVDLRLTQLAIARHRQLLGHRDVATRGVSVGARLARDLPVAVACRPAAKQLFYVDHG